MEVYPKKINLTITYQTVVDKLRAKYNTTYRNSSLESEVDSLSFDESMARHQKQDEKECLRRMVRYLNNITPELVDRFYTESNKTRYLRDAVLGKKWATNPLENTSTA